MISRRTILSALPPLALSAAPPAGAIDTHTHFYDPSRPQGVPWPPKTDSLLYRTTLPADFLKVVSELNVAGTVVVEASPWLEDNQWILDLASENPVIRGFVGNLDVQDPAFAQNLSRFKKNPLFRGIRLGTTPLGAVLSSQKGIESLRRLTEAGLSLDVVGDAPLAPQVALLAARIPELRIVIDHLPFETDPGESLTRLGNHPNVYAKVSNVPRRAGGVVREDLDYYRPALDRLWTIFGPDRLIYGSNWPVSNKVAPYPVAWKLVNEYFRQRGAAAAGKYFGMNAKTAYRWLER